MKRKNYDDDLLVELIARNDRSYARIEADVGVSRFCARDIIKGRYRRDLHPRIRAAAEKLPPKLRRYGPWWPQAREAAPGARKAPDYNDELMVELIARGELSYGEIARRLGVSRAAVARIAAGHTRQDLQEKINMTMRQHLAARRSHPAQTVRNLVECAKPHLTPKRKDYDDDLLIDLIARGEQTYEGIAKQVGLARQTVRRIASGEVRPELQPRIAAAARAHGDQAFRMGARWMRGLLAQHIRDGIEGEGPEARRCREFAMTFIAKYGRFDNIPPPQPPRRPDLTDLSPQLQKQVLEELGGPCEDWMFIDHSDEGLAPGAGDRA